MKKHLIILAWNIRKEAIFNSIIDRFEKHGYMIHLFHNIDNNNFQMDLLPWLISEIQCEARDKVVVISNILEVVFSWFRSYNGLVDGYIYFIDGEYRSFISGWSDQDFYTILFNLCSIEDETVQGKIYLNLDFSNYNILFPLMIHRNRFQYFDLLDNFPLDFKTTKPRISKIYSYNNKNYDFMLPGTTNPPTVINLAPLEDPLLKINPDFTNALDQNKYFIPFFVAKFLQNIDILKHITGYFQHLREFSWEEREPVCKQFLKYINEYPIGFVEKVKLISLLAGMKVEEDSVLKVFMSILKTDRDNMELHYFLLISSLFFVNRGHLQDYECFELDKREVLQKIANSFLPKNLVGNEVPAKQEKRIAIKVDQLLSLLHSPTKVILDYALGLKKYDASLKVKIFVEDNFISCRQEMILPFCYTSAASKDAQSTHLDYLKDTDIEIYYSDPSETKQKRIKELIDEVKAFQPEVILTLGGLSISDYFCYQYYPLVFFSMGEMNFSTPVDIHLVLDLEEVKSYEKKFQVLNTEHLYKFNWGLNLPQPESTITRADYNIAEDEFVLVTVGNRLDGELTEDFAAGVCTFLRDNKNVRWLIIGKAELSFLDSKYQDLLARQIIRKDFEKDLPALYRICDVYVNPPRHGGGYSIALAMNMGLPIAIFGQPSDGLMYVGKENSAGDTLQDYLKNIERLYNDCQYREVISKRMKERIEKFGMEKSIKELLGYFELAKMVYAERNKQT